MIENLNWSDNNVPTEQIDNNKMLRKCLWKKLH